MAPFARDAATGVELNYLDDVGVFGVSNPTAIVQNAQGVTGIIIFSVPLRQLISLMNILIFQRLLGLISIIQVKIFSCQMLELCRLIPHITVRVILFTNSDRRKITQL